MIYAIVLNQYYVRVQPNLLMATILPCGMIVYYTTRRQFKKEILSSTYAYCMYFAGRNKITCSIPLSNKKRQK